MPIRTQAQIARDMTAWLQARLRVVDTGPSTVLYSLLLDALAKSLGDAYTALGNNELAQGIGSPDSVAQSDLDDIAYNLNVTRKPASPAFGFITFRRGTAPSVTIRVGAADGSGGVVVGTPTDANGASVSFVTTQTVFFTPSTPKNPVTGFYEVSAPIQAQQPGVVGDQQAGVITTLISAAQGVTSVVNLISTTNGQDIESNDELAARLVSKLLGFQPGILEGLRTIALGKAGVIDAQVVGPDNPEFQRTVIGAVDLVIKGSALTNAIDTFTFSSPLPYSFVNKPVVSVGQVVSTVGLTQGALVQGAQWRFNQDTQGQNQLSQNSADALGWVGNNLPNPGAQVSVFYTYDALIGTIQSVVSLDSGHFPSANVLVKRGTQVFVSMAFTITRDGTVDTQTLTNNIVSAISNYVASLGLGAKVSQSALVTQIKAVKGIRQLVLPFSQLAVQGSFGASDIQMTRYQYPGVNANSVVITFTN